MGKVRKKIMKRENFKHNCDMKTNNYIQMNALWSVGFKIWWEY